MNKPPCARETRAQLGARFRVLLADTGLSHDAAAQLLHVSPRTIKYWIAGRVRVPYAAYKLVRVMRLFELPCTGWDGWHMHSGRLWSPEGFGFLPADSSWWGLLVRKARLFGDMVDRERQYDILMQRVGPGSAPPRPGGAPVGGHRAAVGSGPTGAAGRAAKPPGLDLSIRDISTGTVESQANQRVTRGRS